jgi:hypothetical protein
MQTTARLFRVPTDKVSVQMWSSIKDYSLFPNGTPVVIDDGDRGMLAVVKPYGADILRRFEHPFHGTLHKPQTAMARLATVEDFRHYRVLDADRYFAQVAKPN